MKEIKRTEISNISLNFNSFVDKATGELVPHVTITFDGDVVKKDAINDKEVATSSLTMKASALRARLYAASDVVVNYSKDRMRSLTDNDVKDLLEAAEKVTVVSSRYEAGEDLDGNIAQYWGIRHTIELEYDDTIKARFNRTAEQRKAAAKAALLA